MLVKGLEGANEDAAVLQDAPHPEVDVLQHLAALSDSLDKHINKHFYKSISHFTNNFGSNEERLRCFTEEPFFDD